MNQPVNLSKQDQKAQQDSRAEIGSPEMAQQICNWGRELGFQQLGFSDIDLSEHEAHLETWLAKDYHGEMKYMHRHGTLRSRPAELHPGTIRASSRHHLGFIWASSGHHPTIDYYICVWVVGRPPPYGMVWIVVAG